MYKFNFTFQSGGAWEKSRGRPYRKDLEPNYTQLPFVTVQVMEWDKLGGTLGKKLLIGQLLIFSCVLHSSNQVTRCVQVEIVTL